MTRRLFRWLPAIGMSIVIISLSAQPGTIPLPFSFADKVYHFVLYAVYGWTVLLAMTTIMRTPRHQIIVAITLALLFAASDEAHQAIVPGRTADALDWCADALGACVGICLTDVIRRYVRTSAHV
ncbi:MAG: VanZ family protein [Chlorobi bacterium]|nr:VanZ family protein [Chlorobiota bacterium]